jgi:hypothetical protein
VPKRVKHATGDTQARVQVCMAHKHTPDTYAPSHAACRTYVPLINLRHSFFCFQHLGTAEILGEALLLSPAVQRAVLA